jgi:hypothetical protein
MLSAGFRENSQGWWIAAALLFRKKPSVGELRCILVCALLVSGCASTIRHSEPTVEQIRDTDITHYRGGSQYYNLSPRQRRRCEERAAQGDIVAAKTLVEYHEMITRDVKQYHHWLKVVARLEKAQQKRH